MRHDAVRRSAREARKAVRFTAHGLAGAVRAPLDGYERARERGQRARTCWGERETLRRRVVGVVGGRGDVGRGRGGCGCGCGSGRVGCGRGGGRSAGVEEGACAVDAGVEVL